MLERPVKILLVCDDSDVAERLRQKTEAVTGVGAVATLRLDEAVSQPAEAGYDLILLDIDAAGEDWDGAIIALRRQMPQVPLIAIGERPQEKQAVQALRAGAQDCLSRAEGEGLALVRVIRHARERSRFQLNLDETGEQRSHDRELGGLGTISGRQPLPVTERSFGSLLLAERVAADFNDLIRVLWRPARPGAAGDDGSGPRASRPRSSCDRRPAGDPPRRAARCGRSAQGGDDQPA